jgi:hypothetical protein
MVAEHWAAKSAAAVIEFSFLNRLIPPHPHVETVAARDGKHESLQGEHASGCFAPPGAAIGRKWV